MDSKKTQIENAIRADNLAGFPPGLTREDYQNIFRLAVIESKENLIQWFLTSGKSYLTVELIDNGIGELLNRFATFPFANTERVIDFYLEWADPDVTLTYDRAEDYGVEMNEKLRRQRIYSCRPYDVATFEFFRRREGVSSSTVQRDPSQFCDLLRQPYIDIKRGIIEESDFKMLPDYFLTDAASRYIRMSSGALQDKFTETTLPEDLKHLGQGEFWVSKDNAPATLRRLVSPLGYEYATWKYLTYQQSVELNGIGPKYLTVGFGYVELILSNITTNRIHRVMMQKGDLIVILPLENNHILLRGYDDEKESLVIILG
jgi:hypothetical protein